eukprot:m.153182 g.153182  ORF g.153182 m.153182 type:complete len:191 (-) comp14345_c0_seq5:201-773(-)
MNVILVMFDITHQKSFESVKYWLDQTDKYSPDGCVVVLVGNKADDVHHREIESSTAQALARCRGIQYVETSAKDEFGVEDAFMTGVKPLMRKVQGMYERWTLTIHTDMPQEAQDFIVTVLLCNARIASRQELRTVSPSPEDRQLPFLEGLRTLVWGVRVPQPTEVLVCDGGQLFQRDIHAFVDLEKCIGK